MIKRGRRRTGRVRFNIYVMPAVKEEVKKICREINPEKPLVEDLLRIAILLYRSDPRYFRILTQRLKYL